MKTTSLAICYTVGLAAAVACAQGARGPRFAVEHEWAGKGQWVRADTHLHTRASDGGHETGPLVEKAKEHGCDVVAITDHASRQLRAATPEYILGISAARKAHPEMVIIAGQDEAGTLVTLPEVWSNGTIRTLTTAGKPVAYYPRMFLAPNGKYFMAGEDWKSRYLSIAGTGAWSGSYARLFVNRTFGSAVMYDYGKILYAGGGYVTNTAEVIDLTKSPPAWQWTGTMAYARRHLNLTVLPTGGVLATGGTGKDAFMRLALRNVLGSLTDVEQLATSDSPGGGTVAHTCQQLNCPRGAQLTEAVRETIYVLEETRSSFKSTQLRDLRRKLNLMLEHM